MSKDIKCYVCGREDTAIQIVGPDGQQVEWCYEHRWEVLETLRSVMNNSRFTHTHLSVDWHMADGCDAANEVEATDDASETLEEAYARARALGYDFGEPVID